MLYGEDFHELTGAHDGGCPLAGSTMLLDVKTSRQMTCPLCGAPLNRGDYRELVDIDKARAEVEDVERGLSRKEDELDETKSRLEDREAEIENMSEVISGLESERDDLRAELEARE